MPAALAVLDRISSSTAARGGGGGGGGAVARSFDGGTARSGAQPLTKPPSASEDAFADLCAPLPAAPPPAAHACSAEDDAAAAATASREEIARLRAKVEGLQSELDYSSVSRAKKFAIKKDMARARAALIKLERKAGLRR